MHDGSAGRSPGTHAVRGTINYSVPTGRQPIFSSRDEHTDLSFAAHSVPITDAGTFETLPTLDAEGFVAASHVGDISEVADSIDAQAEYLRDLAPFMLDLTGADQVIVSPLCIVRRQAPRRATERGPVDFVHSDFTLEGASRMQALSYPFAARREVRRTAMFNIWKLLSQGPTNRPLAVCDARSVAEDDLIAGEARHHLIFGTTFVRHNPAHRWAYFPDLTNTQILVFKQSDTDGANSRVVPHTSFDAAHVLPHAEPRISIESRCVAIWYG